MQKIKEFCKNMNFKKYKLQILHNCLQNIVSHQDVLPSLKFLRKVVKTYQLQKLYDWDREKNTQADVIEGF